MPRLPLQCFIPEFLEAVANQIGRFLCFDKATATLARPSTARLCLELDLRQSPPPFIWVDLFEGLKQPIIYERMPKFCPLCIAQGHTAVDCPTGQREAIRKQAVPNSRPIHGRPPTVRQNATRGLPSKSAHQHASSATNHNLAIPTPPPPPPVVAPQATGTHLSAPSSATEDVVQPCSSTIHPVHYAASKETQLRLPPPPDPPLDDSPSPTVVQGHMATDCPLGHRETCPHHSVTRPMANQSRPPPARHNVVGSSSLQQHIQPSTPRPPASHQHTPRHVPSTSQHQQSEVAVLPVQRPADPPASLNPQNPQHSANHPPPSCSLCFAQGHAAVECPSGLREATTEQTDPPQSSFKDCTPSVRQNASQKLQSTSDLQQASLPTNHSSPIPSSSPPSPLPAIPVPPLTAPATIIPAILHNTTPSTSSLQQTDKQLNPAVCLPLQSNLDAIQQALSAGTAPPHASSWAIPPLLSQQYNLKANQMFWNAVNQHLTLASQQTSSPRAAIPPPPGSSSSRPLAADPHPLSAVSIAEGTPSVCHNAELPNSANNETLGEDQQIESIIEHPNSAAKPINLKQLEVDRSPLLNQQQQDALERFKKKVRAQTQSQGQQLIGSTSANPFEALIEDQSDEEDDDYIAASFNSDTDDGPVEPIDMGYQSADGRSSHNHTKSSAPVMKINKRHPNIPLNVRLRTRKNSYSSSHKYLCM